MSSRTDDQIAAPSEIWSAFQTIVSDGAPRTGACRPRLSLVLAELQRRGAKDAGAEVRLRRAVELRPEKVIRRQHAWREHYERTVALVAEANDLEQIS